MYFNINQNTYYPEYTFQYTYKPTSNYNFPDIYNPTDIHNYMDDTLHVNELFDEFINIYISSNYPAIYYSGDLNKYIEVAQYDKVEISYKMYLTLKQYYNDYSPIEIAGLSIKVAQLSNFNYPGLFPGFHNELRLMALKASTDQLEDLDTHPIWRLREDKHLRKQALEQQITIFQQPNIIDRLYLYFRYINQKIKVILQNIIIEIF